MGSSTSLAAEKTATVTGGSTETLQGVPGSSYTQLHHIGSYPSPVQQVYPAQGHQHVGSQQVYQGNPVYQTNPNFVHQLQVNSTHQINPIHQLHPVQQGNPAYQVNTGQFTRYLHHYDPTQVNTSYSHSSSDVLRHQMEHLHATHPHPAHHYGNSGFSFKR